MVPTHGPKKYYIEHHPNSVFNNQEKLAKLLDNFGKRESIESKEVSPLTIRLFCAYEGLERASEFVKEISGVELPSNVKDDLNLTNYDEYARLYREVYSSGAQTFGYIWPVDKTDLESNPTLSGFQGMYELFKAEDGCKYIKDPSRTVSSFGLHAGIYTFFSNIDSVFDRIRFEVNSIYFGKAQEYDHWSDYISKTKPAFKRLSKHGFSKVADILTGSLSESLDKMTSKYRNRLIHDGILNVRIEPTTCGVFLPDRPNDANPNYDVDALSHLKKIDSNLQNFLQEVYNQVIEDVKTAKSLPLIP
ncbi:MAG: hypothetical protein ABIK83_08395 [Candidatus Zixiibacteriota bacterium]